MYNVKSNVEHLLNISERDDERKQKKHDGRKNFRRVKSTFSERAAVNKVDDLRGLGELPPTSVLSKYAHTCFACKYCFS